MAVYCPKCGNTFAASLTNVPPWCTRCGSDLPRPKPAASQPPPVPADALEKAPSASLANNPPPDGAFQEAPSGGASA
jgi:hypothetical protein